MPLIRYRSDDREPGLLRKLVSVAEAGVEWTRCGFRVVSSEMEDRRMQICRSCAHYDPQGNLGLGKCRLCGCTRWKAKLPASRCKIGLW